MTFKPFILIPALLLLTLTGCSKISSYVANSMAESKEFTQTSDISYGPLPEHNLDVYVPPDMKTNPLKRPVVVFYYGGCWGRCASIKQDGYKFVAQTLTEKGYVVVIPEFRQYPDAMFPIIMEDTSAALGWVTKNIDSYGGDPSQLFLMGHSSGAHIAASLHFDESYLSHETYQHIAGLISLAGPFDFLPFTASYQEKLFGPESAYPKSQPINFVDGSEPPTLILHGEDDSTVGRHNAENMTAKIKSKKGNVQTVYLDNINHTGIVAEFSIPFREKSQVLDLVVAFIEGNIQTSEVK